MIQKLSGPTLWIAPEKPTWDDVSTYFDKFGYHCGDCHHYRHWREVHEQGIYESFAECRLLEEQGGSPDDCPAMDYEPEEAA